MRSLRYLLPAVLILLVGASTASAKPKLIKQFAYANSLAPGAKRLHFQYGPIKITPGQNFINTEVGIPKPKVDGYITRFDPNLHYAIKGTRRLGAVPRVDVIHLHHGVWLSTRTHDATSNFGPVERFAAAGEEKTRLRFPNGYGYPYQTSNNWILNYMIHNLTDVPTSVWVTYDIDFVPATAPQAKTMRAARPIWMDVENGGIYPVFNALRGMGKHGTYTFPTQAKDPYGNGPAKNKWTVDQDGTLIATAGHLHPGGLHTDLYDSRAGKTAHLFRSQAHYYEPAGAVSWDVSMTGTRPNWRVNVKKGDVLSTTATYDTSHASWYEVMGIMVVFMADGQHGLDPFTHKVDQPGGLTHGHLAENRHHGGVSFGMPNPLKLPSGSEGGTVDISHYIYGRGHFLSGGKIPTVQAGKSLTFKNLDQKGPKDPNAAWHTITACKAPCNKSTGIAYPVANSNVNVNFDSGQLGQSPTGAPTTGSYTWKTPTTLQAGTYTYFCRVHPFMRGAFRVVH